MHFAESLFGNDADPVDAAGELMLPDPSGSSLIVLILET